MHKQLLIHVWKQLAGNNPKMIVEANEHAFIISVHVWTTIVVNGVNKFEDYEHSLFPSKQRKKKTKQKKSAGKTIGVAPFLPSFRAAPINFTRATD